MVGFAPVYPSGADYETVDAFNPFVAVEIARADSTLVKLMRCLRAAARDLLADCPHPLLDELSTGPLGRSLSKRALQAAASKDELIEQLCVAYFERASAHRLLDISRYDPFLMADLLIAALLEEDPWEAECTLFRHNRRIEHQYKGLGWHLLAPWAFAISYHLPDLHSLRALHAAIDDLADENESTTIAGLLLKAGLPPRDAYVDLLWFLCCNRPDVCMTGSGARARVVAIRKAVPRFDLLSELAAMEGWVRNPCRKWGFRIGDSSRIEANTAALDANLSIGGERLTGVGTSDIAIKVALNQLLRVELEQGLPKNIRRAIITALEKEQRVVSVADLRKMLGAPTLRVDPFGVTSGRVLVYAPSSRFLESGKTAFVLRDWVQDTDRRRARIAPDRILTPLSPVLWGTNRDDLLKSIRDNRAFALFGVAFWDDVRRGQRLIVAAQAKRWAEHQLFLGARSTLKSRGFHVVEDVFFSGVRWQTLPRSRTAFRLVAEMLTSAPEWAEARASHPFEVSEAVERLLART